LAGRIPALTGTAKVFARIQVSDTFASMLQSPPVVLTIAGFDPSSGAGITADIKTIAAHGCYGTAAITALTVQSTAGVGRFEAVEPKLLLDSLNALTADVKVSAVHIGMLATAPLASTVAEFLQSAQLPNLVLDPVLASSSGTKLIDKGGMKVVIEKLLPLTTVVTPNAFEAAALTGLEVESLDDMKKAATRFHQLGAKGVVITGGHLEPSTDILSIAEGDYQTFKSERLDVNFTHGTGCAFSTAVACNLAQGRPLPEAVLLAKAYVTAAIGNGYPIGKGTNPVNHMYRMKNHPAGFAKKLASGRD
jgi:hydroxymethylpyrimidine/phosphomethylpyrimidine kinase